MAGGLETLYQNYKDQGLMVIAAYSEDAEYETPDVEDLMSWANKYGITAPVLQDSGSSLYWRFGTGSLPSMVLLGPGMEVLEVGFLQESIVEDYLGEPE